MSIKSKYDVIIAGGGTAGCACAYIAGKLGLSVLLVEKNSFLGGSMTSSLVVPAMKTSEKAINTDFYTDFYKNLKNINGVITYSDGNNGWFNPELTKIVLDKMLKSNNVDILFNSCIQSCNKSKSENLSPYNVTIYSDNPYFCYDDLLVRTDTIYMVDATGDAKISKLLNFEFLNNKNETQPYNLRFIMSGVNSEKFAKWITKYDKNRDITTSYTLDGNTYFSTAYTWDTGFKWALEPIFKQAVNDGVLEEQDTNYFQVFSVAGTHDSVCFNCPRITDTNMSVSDGLIAARASILRISEFCRKYLPGFEKAYISSIANSLGVRVSNRVKGKYVYTKEDLLSGKKFDNPVVISNYPIDIHSGKKDGSKLQKVMQEYQLPLEALMVDDNFFVIGRCLSADFEAQAALRIIPSCFSMGEGLAKYLSKRNLNNKR